MKGIERLGVGTVCVALLACTASTTASAFSITYQSDPKLLPARSQGSARVACPPKQWITGGGVYTGGSSLEDEVAGSAPYDGPDTDAKPDDGWRGTVNTGPDAAYMTTYAICEDYSPTRYRTASLTGQPGQAVSLEVGCGTGTMAVGGGVSLAGHSTRRPLISTGPTLGPDGWSAYAANPTSHAANITVTAICMPNDYWNFSFDDVYFTNKSIDPGTQEAIEGPVLSPFGSPRLGCAKTVGGAGRIYGGGAQISTFDGVGDSEIASLYPIDGEDSDTEPNDAWKAWFNNEATQSRAAAGIAMCQNG